MTAPSQMPAWIAPTGRLDDDVVSVTILATATTRTRVSIEVRDAADALLVDIDAPEQSPNRVLGTTAGVLSGTIPSSSAALPLAGNYRVGASATGDGDVVVSVWTKHASSGHRAPRTQDLPLVVFTVGDTRPDEVRLSIALGEIGRIWRTAGIEIGEPARARIDGSEGTRFERLQIVPTLGSDSPQLGELLRLSARAPAPGLSLFLVGDISSASGSAIWALSGGIPVPPVAGTIRSGIAVNATLVDVDPVRAGQVIAHEIGHALGLFHTTEGPILRAAGTGAPRALHDQLLDTPECPAQADVAPADGVLSAGECEDHDAGNLMFWAATRGASSLSAAQADIARRSALCR